MLLKQFPDIEWLRAKSKSNFADGKGINGVALPDRGWPTVVLNTHSIGAERRNIVGPFSLFMNLSGRSIVGTERLQFALETDTYCITNKGQHYDLIIPERSQTTTFNIHFGERLFLETVYALQNGDSSLLEDPFGAGQAGFQTFPRTVWKDKHFRAWISRLVTFYQCMDSTTSEAELLSAFLEFILVRESSDLKTVRSIHSLKTSTRYELMRRVLRAVEYIHDGYSTEINLDDLSKVSFLSKFHLQRTFRQVKGLTPQQYLARVRLEKACDLIENSDMPLAKVAAATGFSELSSFSRFFRHHTKEYPSTYRTKLARLVK